MLHRTTRFVAMVTIAKAAILYESFDVGKGFLETGFCVPQTQFSHTGSIDKEGTVLHENELPMCCRMTTFIVVFTNFANLHDLFTS
ncbi:hypothetical protein SDC9_210745 [bioreactor metagenome]|uniref:Uncharacterized protein n=1 Tax=bioreactor metagenome TaxID=1076179 RepID=A0A645JHA1_9ZZZZ